MSAINADSEISNNTSVGGRAAGGQVAAGAVVAVGVDVSTTRAALMRDLDANGGLDIHAESLSKNTVMAVATARGASASKYAEKSGKTEDEVLSGEGDSSSSKSTSVLSEQKGNTEKSGKGSVAFAAAVGVNVVDNDTIAQVGKGVKIKTGDAVSVTAAANNNAKTLGSGSSIVGPHKTIWTTN